MKTHYVRGILTAAVVVGLMLAPAFAGAARAAAPLVGTVGLAQGARLGASPVASASMSLGAAASSSSAVSSPLPPSAISASATPALDTNAIVGPLQETEGLPLPPGAVTSLSQLASGPVATEELFALPVGSAAALPEVGTLSPEAIMSELEEGPLIPLPSNAIAALPEQMPVTLTPEQILGLPEQTPLVLPPETVVANPADEIPLPPNAAPGIPQMVTSIPLFTGQVSGSLFTPLPSEAVSIPPQVTLTPPLGAMVGPLPVTLGTP